MKRFLLYCLLFVLPFIVVLFPYIITDPFKVLYYHENYYVENGEGYYINTNRSFVTMQMYNRNKDRYKYDSFIIGSSRSGFYLVEDWKQYIPDSAHCFHLDGYGESLYNTHKKLKYIDGKSPIRNAMFCVERDWFYQDQQDYGHLWVLPPYLVENNFGAFHMAFIRAYLNPKFLHAYWDIMLTGNLKPYMFENGIFEKPSLGYKVESNERNGENRYIQMFPESHYENISKPFPPQPDTITYGFSVIKESQKQMLYEIHDILVRNQTNYKIILNPIYDQLLFAPEDKDFLLGLFGKHIVDFSGKNRITDDYHYYGDPSHFNEYVASEVMRIVYEKDSVRQKQMLDSLYYAN